MKTIAISAAALSLGLCFAAQAHAQNGAKLNDPAQLQREHARAAAAHDWANDPYNPKSSNDLNRRQLSQAQSMGTGPSGMVYSDDGLPANANAEATADTGTQYSSDQNYSSDDSNTTVTVIAPAHESREGSPEPDTSPQSTGTPSIDTPYIKNGQAVAPDGDSSGMIQPKAQ